MLPSSSPTEDFFAGLEGTKRSTPAIEARREWDWLRSQEQLSGYKMQQDVILREQLRADEKRRKQEPARPVVFHGEQQSWTVNGCEDALYYLENTVMRLVSNRTPFQLGSLEYCRWQSAADISAKEEKHVRDDLKYMVICLVGYHDRIHRVQHALHQLVGDESDEWSQADRVGCLITKYVAIVKDLLNHLNGGVVEMYDCLLCEMFLYQSEPQ
ncbi:hypothetical protein CONPUDRAFT_72078 [Coniophora puteana RWD-64-598 SS2]|uniref:Uncharacterized protein n=1 Tax=Coniophora puteana (strain RWD-64-598) TaxID=741705 RepID=A0A5M3MSZ8_CONPW|nr:uncharacterized protein CONPUDRAFT_72078 [Coniophora puteana RWD-64-598 SS2]EIW81651.1 hypothetical protein CONPUDRAFT_72078 [Coniophora puteana RWD-64-598 SS2]